MNADAAAGPAAAGLSLASIGFGVMGDLQKGKGEKAGQEFMAARAERAAEIGRIKADQTAGQLQETLATTLANIDAVRVAANADPNAPTAIAIKANETRIAQREITNRTFALRAQAAEDEAEAIYRRRVGRDAIRASYLGAGARITKGLAPVVAGLAPVVARK